MNPFQFQQPNIQIDFDKLVEKNDDELLQEGDVFLKIDPDGICNYVISQEGELPENAKVSDAKLNGFLQVFKTGV